MQFLAADGEALTAYAYADDLPETLLERSALDEIALTTNFALVFVDDGKVAIFEVDGEAPFVEELPPVEIPEESEMPVEQPTVSDEEELTIEDEPAAETIVADEGAFVLVSTIPEHECIHTELFFSYQVYDSELKENSFDEIRLEWRDTKDKAHSVSILKIQECWELGDVGLSFDWTELK